MNEEYLEHHGIKGQKWGVRRFQNADGSLTDDGRKRYGTGEARSKTTVKDVLTSKTVKNIGKVALIAGSVIAAESLYQNNRSAIDRAVSEMASNTVRELTGVKQVTTALGKSYTRAVAKDSFEAAGKMARDMGKGIADGARAGVVAAPGKVVKVAVEGAALMAAKKFLESVTGEESVANTIQAYNAYNKKNKVGRVPSLLRRDDDDDD